MQNTVNCDKGPSGVGVLLLISGTLIVAAYTSLALCAEPKGESRAIAPEPPIRVGDTVVVTVGPAPVKLGDKTLTALASGSSMTVIAVRGGWVGVAVQTEGQRTKGWVNSRSLRRLDPDALDRFATEAAPGSPAKADLSASSQGDRFLLKWIAATTLGVALSAALGYLIGHYKGGRVRCEHGTVRALSGHATCLASQQRQGAEAQLVAHRGIREGMIEAGPSSRRLGMTYPEYIRSPLWFLRRTECIKRVGGICELCERRPANTGHHIYYPPDFRDDRLEYLVAVCPRCHDILHGLRTERRGRTNRWAVHQTGAPVSE